MCPPVFPWTATHFTVSLFIPDCTGNSTARLQSASNRLSSLPLSDIQVWTDGSVPSLFGPGGAGVYVTCSKCHTSNSLSFSTGPNASSFTAETFAFKQGPNRLPISPFYPFISPLLLPSRVPLECLVPRLLHLQQHQNELPMGPRSYRSPW